MKKKSIQLCKGGIWPAVHPGLGIYTQSRHMLFVATVVRDAVPDNKDGKGWSSVGSDSHNGIGHKGGVRLDDWGLV